MNENEQKTGSVADQKSKIRERYKGINPDELDVIPALPQEDIFAVENEQRVAVYARVSTDDPRQTSSYELQKNHYHDVISKSPNWKLVQIYADEGISGTSLQHRDQFKLMIEDCKKGQIDLIVTKSVSRFARNVVDCIGYVRELLALPHPVGVFFETERLNTFDPKSEMVLSFMATLAQEESHTKSEIMNASIEMRFRRGIFLTPILLGISRRAGTAVRLRLRSGVTASGQVSSGWTISSLAITLLERQLKAIRTVFEALPIAHVMITTSVS